MSKIFSVTAIADNFTDIMIICLQSYCFFIKVSDADTFDYNPADFLRKEMRSEFIDMHFLARNFHDFLSLETICLIFVFFKMIDGVRYIQKVNNVVCSLIYSSKLILLFVFMFILINVALSPLAQAVWGHHLVGYKTFENCLVSVFMIFVAKGDLDRVIDINFTWSLVFLTFYYFMIIFLNTGIFHQI